MSTTDTEASKVAPVVESTDCCLSADEDDAVEADSEFVGFESVELDSIFAAFVDAAVGLVVSEPLGTQPSMLPAKIPDSRKRFRRPWHMMMIQVVKQSESSSES